MGGVSEDMDSKKAKNLLLIMQVSLWSVVIVMEILVILVKNIYISEHIYFLISLNLFIMSAILINIYNYTKENRGYR